MAAILLLLCAAAGTCFVQNVHCFLLEDNIFQKSVTIGSVRGTGIRKVDGIAASRIHPDILYVQNGGHHAGPILVVVNASNSVIRGIIHISGIGIHDWQDIAVGLCHGGSKKTCIYIADTGNDKGHPPANVIYRLEEPLSVDGNQTIAVNGMLKFSYDEKGSKTLMVGNDATVWLVSYVQGGAGLLVQFSSKDFNSTNRITATSNVRINILHTQHKDPVGGDISVDGNEILIKTRTHVFYWNVENHGIVRLAEVEPVSLPYTYEFQDEAICWSPRGNGYYTLSEGNDIENPVLKFYRRV